MDSPMKQILKSAGLAVALLACHPAASVLADEHAATDMQDAEAVARAYMAHYSALDLDAMASFWADDIMFSDPTALGEGLGEDGHQMHGRDEARATLQAFIDANRPIELGFDWHTVFESNDRVIFMGHVNALYPTDTDGQTFRWRSPQVTVLTVREGKIVHQVDYADYDDADRSLVLN